MRLSPSGPGKLAPKLYQDILIFDPLKSAGLNLLTGHAPPAGEGPQLAPAIGSCQHEYTVKDTQSVPPPLDLRPDRTTKYKLAIVCKKCRIHADIQIDYSEATSPCPNADYPLHHFQHLDDDISTRDRIRYSWQCSAPYCHALLHVGYRMARISDTERDLLTNTELLRRRYEAIVAQDPAREDVRQATPMESLSRLRKYTKDALNPAHSRRSFPANNKRFMEAFGVYGQDCHELLSRLGFKYADMEWALPNPPPVEERLEADGRSHRELLEDVEIELVAWMFKISADTGLVNPVVTQGWPPANRDMERILGGQMYQRHISMRRENVGEVLPYFNSLGAIPDFADGLVQFAYDRQSLCDPERSPYYFECLQVIAENRGTEALQTKVLMLESQNAVSRRDLSAAYRSLGIPPGEASSYSDGRILSLFQARQPDLSPAAAEDLRHALFKIGTIRQSGRLIGASRQSVDTYEGALAWLGNGADTNTPDDALLAIFGVKVAESKANEQIGAKAIATIARARQSNMLNNWLLTGNADGYSMTIDEALRIVGVPGKLEDVEPSILPTIYANARYDRPGENTEKAISAIEEHLSGINASILPTPASMPVGLISHGNTCYLNSLLQYYFAIKPLRNVVLEYEKYKLPLEAHTVKTELVGRLKIDTVEIEGGQRFAKALQRMFVRMISDPGTAVKPHEELVCRAFLDPKDYALMVTDDQDVATNGNNNSGNEKKSADITAMEEPDPNHDAAEAGQESMTSSTTLQGDDNDTTMTDGGPLPTPPASPSSKPKDDNGADQPSDPPTLPPRRFSTSTEDRLVKAEEKARQQQDVAEVHDAVMYRLRAGMKPQGKDEEGEQIDSLRRLYAIRGIETPIHAQGQLSKGKLFYDSSIQLNVPVEDTDLYSALDEYFDLQPRGDDSNFNTFKSLRHVPPLLQISMPRIGFNKAKGEAYKSNVMMRLEDELYLDRYLDESDILPSRQRCWDWRRRLRALRQEEKDISAGIDDNTDGPMTVAKTAEYLNGINGINDALREVEVDGLDIDDEILNGGNSLVASLESEAEILRSRLVELKTEIEALQRKLGAEFGGDDFKQIKYRLAVVFMHRGSPYGGHYWVFIRDFANDLWRSYNDETVTTVSPGDLESKIFAAKQTGVFNSAGTPTYAVYVLDDRKEEYVQPLCREPEATEAPEGLSGSTTADMQMQDAPQPQPQPEPKPANWVDPKAIQESGESNSWDEPKPAANAEW